MTEAYVSVNGQRVTNLRVLAGNTGPWIAEGDMEGAPELSGRALIRVGELELSGTIDPASSGTFGLQTKLRIVGGAGAWGVGVLAKNYHNDAGVKARTVAEDAARAVGETIGTFVPTAERVGADYVRQVGPASRTLEDVAKGAPWWVDYAGVTHVGPRAAVTPADKSYTVLAFDPRASLVTLAVDDPRAVVIGSTLTSGLDGPQVVRELELRITPDELRMQCWTGGAAAGAGHLASMLRAIIARVTDGKLWGAYRYRVVKMAGQRVELQAVRKAAGLPDVLPVSLWPGIPGMHATLTPGAIVLVEFVEGDRTLPIVTHFAGADSEGFVPVELVLGGTAGSPAARQGDAVEVLLPPMVFSGTIGGVPASGVVTSPLVKTLGVITAGSSKVKVAL